MDSGLGLAFSQWQASIAAGIPAEQGEVHFWFLLAHGLNGEGVVAERSGAI